MRRTIKVNPIAFIFMLLFTQTSCDKDSSEGITANSIPVDVDVDFNLKLDLSMDSTVAIQTYAAYTALFETMYDTRIIVDVYKAPATEETEMGERIQRVFLKDNTLGSSGEANMDVKLKLIPGKYQALLWVDFVRKGSLMDYYYNTRNLKMIRKLTPTDGTANYDVSKDAFAGSFPIDILLENGKAIVKPLIDNTVKRPFAFYRIVTTDMEKYNLPSQESTKPTTTFLTYNLFFPTEYDVQFQVPDGFKSDIGYQFAITDFVSPKEAVIASDYVFITGDSFYGANFDIKDALGGHINTVQGLRINLKQNMTTTIRGEFLTKALDGGQVGIDEKFDGEIIVQVP